MKIDGKPVKKVATRSGLTLQWENPEGFFNVAIGLVDDVEKAHASNADVSSDDLHTVKLRKVV
jgi:hypothetical protein